MSACAIATGPVRADDRAQAELARLIAQLTVDEKLGLLEGQSEPDSPDKQWQAGYLPGVPRLGIPALRLADGPPGVATRQPSTGMPCTMALAATFSERDAEQNGEVIGRDARALGQDLVLEPFVNLDRDFAWGRGFNTLGEDPLLAGQLAAAQIRGIQRQGVMAQIKHFIAFEGAYNVSVDERTLHEVYLLPFALAVDAGVASIMCAYNVVNGTQACGSAALLTELLRNELGFGGFVTSDWGANHATTYLNAGLDLEMPGGGPAAGVPMPSYFARDALREALAAGSIRMARVDEAVTRILGQYQRFGLLSGGSRHAIHPEDRAGDARVVRQTAENAATLLYNRDRALPLSAAALHSLALIGPGALQTIATYGGGEKPGGIQARQLGTYEVLRRRLQRDPTAHVSQAIADDLTGVSIPPQVLSHDGTPGLARTDGSGARASDAQIAFLSARGNALPPGYNATWSGTLEVPQSGDYWLNIQALGATAELRVDGRTLNIVGSGMTAAPRYGVVHPADGNAPVPTPDGLANSRAWLHLEQGSHALAVEVRADASGVPVQVRLCWVPPEQRAADRARALEVARAAHTVVVFAFSLGDLSAPLPEDQDALIAEIAAANPNTIVVLNTSQPVGMPWLPAVKAVLQMWYPGDEGGEATADVLLGRANPAGHLPFTWPYDIAQTAPYQREHPERALHGVGGSGTCSAFGEHTGHNCGLTTYSEGVQIGYRYFDATDQTPRFAFGFGLSYTTFAYSDLRVDSQPDGSLQVSFRVRNIGGMAGDAVPQVYLGAPARPPEGLPFAKRALAGFARVRIEPGRSELVRVRVPARQLQYWSLTRGWTAVPGPRALIVAQDARAPLLQTELPAR